MYAFAVFGCARTLFKWTVDRDLLEHSPCDHVNVRAHLSRSKEPRQRVLSDDEIVAFWKATGRMPYPWRDLFRLLLLTGTTAQRGGGRALGRVRTRQGLWTVPPERFKSNSSHLVPLSADAWRWSGAAALQTRRSPVLAHVSARRRRCCCTTPRCGSTH